MLGGLFSCHPRPFLQRSAPRVMVLAGRILFLSNFRLTEALLLHSAAYLILTGVLWRLLWRGIELFAVIARRSHTVFGDRRGNP